MLYLHKRNDYFYIRVRVPIDVQHLIRMKEIKLSLKTRKRKDAIVIGKSYSFKLERIFTLARCGMLTDNQIMELLTEFKHKTLKDMEDDRVHGKGVMTPKEYDDPESYGNYYEGCDEACDILKEALITNDLNAVEASVDDLLVAQSMALDKKSEQYKKICREMLKVWIAIYEIEMERVKGNYDNEYDRGSFNVPIPQSSPSLSTDTCENDKPLSEVVIEFLNEKTITGSANEDTIKAYNETFELMKGIVGDVPLRSLNTKTFQTIAETIAKLPKNMNVYTAYKGLPIKEVLEAIKGKSDVKLLSTDTRSKHISRISGLMKWAIKHDYADKNFAEGLAKKKKDSGETKRDPFSKDDLNMLIKSKIYREIPINKPHQFFIPLIALFAGMRMNEICQLDVADIIQRDGYYCFDINENAPDKKLKNKNAKRIVPIHPILKDVGFLDYVDHIAKQGHRKLWTGLKYEHNNYKHKFSKWWNIYCDKHVVDDKRKVFHSFRNTLINNLKQKKVDQALVSGIVGHNNPIITYSTYGADYEPKPLYDVLMVLDYGLDFSGIRFPVQEL